MISVFGDESSSSALATYGLLAIADVHLPLLEVIFAEARRSLRAPPHAPLHGRVLFHSSKRQKSDFANATNAEVEKACQLACWQASQLEIGLYFGKVERKDAPKVMHVPLVEGTNTVLDARTKLELAHLQFFAYSAASGTAQRALPIAPKRVVVDQNRSVVRWFNQHRQASRLLELLTTSDPEIKQWPPITLGDDHQETGLQFVDLLTYCATKAVVDPRFEKIFAPIRTKTQFMTFEFAKQTHQPYTPPDGVSVRKLPPRR